MPPCAASSCTPRRNRRAVAALLAAIALVVGACSGEAEPSSGARSGGRRASGWSFPDGTGGTVELDHAPRVLAAQSVIAGALWEYGVVADGVFGALRRADGTDDPGIGLAEPDDFTSLGEVDSEINLELLAALQPDVIVTAMWNDDQYMGIDDAEVDQIRQIAPIIGIPVGSRPVTEPLAQIAELAESIGARPARVQRARAEFAAAAQRLEAALAQKPDLQVVAASGAPTEMYVANPPAWPDLRFFQSLGMRIAQPEHHPTSSGYWETLSWEQTDKYPADLILADSRVGGLQWILDFLPATARNLPAVRAEQIVEWDAAPALGYRNVARVVDRLAGQVERARTDVDS